MANPFSSINLDELKADAALVATVVAVVEKYQDVLPIPSSAKSILVDVEKGLTFGISVLEDV